MSGKIKLEKLFAIKSIACHASGLFMIFLWSPMFLCTMFNSSWTTSSFPWPFSLSSVLTPYNTHDDHGQKRKNEWPCAICAYAMEVQLHPTITDLKEPSIFIHYKRISAIAIIRNKDKFSPGTKNLYLPLADFRYSWIRYSGIQLYQYSFWILTIF